MSPPRQDLEQFSIDPADIWHEVFGYAYPEVRALLGSLVLDERFHMNTITAPEASAILHDGNYSFSSDLVLPHYANGRLNHDGLHEPVIDRITRRNEPELPGLSDFDKQYPTQGSTMAIRTLMAEWSRTGKMTELAVIEGEYEGYSFIAGELEHRLGLVIPVHKVASLEEAGKPVKGRIWFVSNPSATNGNWHNDELWKQFVAAGHDIVYDAAYVGLAANSHPIDVSAPNIKAVLTSPSKIFGVFRHRLTGIVYTRDEIFSLIDTMWFKDVPALLATLALNEAFGTTELPAKYKEDQLTICQSVSEYFDKEIKPSDAILLSHTNVTLPPEYAHYQRIPKTYRLGITRFFELLELHKQGKDRWYDGPPSSA